MHGRLIGRTEVAYIQVYWPLAAKGWITQTQFIYAYIHTYTENKTELGLFKIDEHKWRKKGIPEYKVN